MNVTASIGEPSLIPFHAGVYQIALSGQVNAALAPELESKLRHALDRGARHILLDCAALDLIDSAGLSATITALKHLRKRGGGEIIFHSVNENTGRILRLTKMDQYFGVVANSAEALARLGAPPASEKSGPLGG